MSRSGGIFLRFSCPAVLMCFCMKFVVILPLYSRGPHGRFLGPEGYLVGMLIMEPQFVEQGFFDRFMENEKRVDIVFSIGGFQVFRKMPVDKDLLEVVAVACEVRNIPCPVELCPFRIFFTAKPRISAETSVSSLPILFFFFTAIYSSLVALKERSDLALLMLSELCELSLVAFSELCELS